MSLIVVRRNILLRLLGVEYDRETQRYLSLAPKNGEIPVGGGDWMDSFIRSEGVRGVILSLRAGADIQSALEEGKKESQKAVKKWNVKREWQVHRWEGMANAYLENMLKKVIKHSTIYKES